MILSEAGIPVVAEAADGAEAVAAVLRDRVQAVVLAYQTGLAPPAL
jgi:hypothetical protein